MAKVMQSGLACFCSIVLLLFSWPVFAAQDDLSQLTPAFKKAAEFENQGDWTKAAEVYSDVIAKEPNRMGVLLKLVEINNAHLDNPRQAIYYLKRAIQLKPSTADLYFRLARLYSDLNEPQAALDAMLNATKYARNNPVYLEYQLLYANWAKANKHIDHTIKQLLAIEPGNKTALMAKAQQATIVKNYDTSIQIYSQLLKTNPEKKILWENLIHAYGWQGSFLKAAETLNAFEQRFPYEYKTAQTYRTWLLAMERQVGKLDPRLAALAKIFPMAGLEAEHEKRWQDAIKIYQTAYKTSRNQYQLLFRIGQIQEHLKQYDKAAQTFQKAAAFEKNNPVLYKRIALNYELAGQTRLSLNAIDEALKLTPKDIDLLIYKGRLATQLELFHVGRLAYKRVLALQPNNVTALLALAYYNAHDWQWDKAIEQYERILTLYPKNSEALIMLVSLKSWIGDYRAAMHTLSIYRHYYGETKQYSETKARVYAESNHPLHALKLVYPLLEQDPDNTNYRYTEALAYHYNNEPKRALRALDKLNKVIPNNPEIIGLNSFIKTPLRSSLSFEGNYFQDTDSVDINYLLLSGRYFISPVTSLLVQTTAERLSAHVDSGLNPIGGNQTIRYYRGLFGVNHIFNPHFTLTALGGAGYAKNSGLFAYDVQGDFKVNDFFKFNVLESHQMYDVSPRSVSLGIKKQLTQIGLSLEPSLQRYILSQFSYATFSDGNTMWQYTLNPSVPIYRSQKWQINGGLYGNWFGFSKTPSHGYYSPEFYQFYGTVIHVYYAYSPNIGYTFSGGIGEQKDETFDTFKFATDVSIKAAIGIFKTYELVLTASGSSRGRSISSDFSGGNYYVYTLSATLTKRF